MNTLEIGYIQHGKAGEPMRTESINIRHIKLSEYKAFYQGKWRTIDFNLKTQWFRFEGKNVYITGWAPV